MSLLDDEEIEGRLRRLEGWSRTGDAIRKVYERGNFTGSVGFVNAITPIAEEMNHHPDLEISWGTVSVSLCTHSAGGLTEADFELASRIDSIA